MVIITLFNMSFFTFSSEECELLYEFEENSNVEKLSLKMNKDPSVISRALTKISQKAPVLEKIKGRWSLTSMGRKLNVATKEHLLAQKLILGEEEVLRIGSNREFLSRIIVPSLSHLKKELGNPYLVLKSFESGTESHILSGNLDIGIDCGKPHNPDVAFKLCTPEPISIFCSNDFLSKHKSEIKNQNFKELPLITCERLLPEKIDSEFEYDQKPYLHFNDLAAAREACILGHGILFLPNYSVQKEVSNKLLIQISTKMWNQEKYGVWWLKSRKHLQNKVEVIKNWLTQVNLK